MYIIEAAPHILNSFDAALSTLIRSQLSRRRVIVRTSVSVTSFDAGSKLVHLSDGSSISTACVVWNAGLQPVKLMTEGLAPLCKGAGGRIVVDDQLHVAAPESGGRVFAIGDCAIDPNKPCPPIAQAAKQQGRHLARAFNAAPAACAENDGACVQVDAFTLRHMGSMVTWGGFKGAVDLHKRGSKRPRAQSRGCGWNCRVLDVAQRILGHADELGQQTAYSDVLVQGVRVRLAVQCDCCVMWVTRAQVWP